MRKNSVNQAKSAYMQKLDHRKLESLHKLLTAQTAVPVREIVLDGALLTYFSPFFC